MAEHNMSPRRKSDLFERVRRLLAMAAQYAQARMRGALRKDVGTQAEQSTATQESLDAYAAAFDRENSELRERVEALEQENRDLKEQNRNLSALQTRQNHAITKEDGEPSPAPTEFRSVMEVVDWAKRLNGLFFLEEAERSATKLRRRKRTFLDLRDVFQTMAECAGERARGPLGQDVKAWLAARGVKYVAGESPTTMGQHGKERTFLYGGQQVAMPAHIRVGRKVRIHCRWLENEKVWLVGHVGEHLPTATG